MAEYNSSEDTIVMCEVETPTPSEAERRAHEARRLLQELEARTQDVRRQLLAYEGDTCGTRVSPSADTIRCHEEGNPSALEAGTPPAGQIAPSAEDREGTEAEVFVQPRVRYPRQADYQGLKAPMVGAPVHFKPEPFDGSSDWPEYLVYFEQLAEVHGWDHNTMAIVLGLSLKGSARSVLANMNLPQRRDYRALKDALTQHFCPPQQIHLYQAELKARKRKPNESLPELGREISRLIRLAYPSADTATRETIGINAFLDAIPGPAIEVRLNVLRGHPTTILEAVALAMEVDALFEAEASRKPGGWKNRVHNVEGETEESQIAQLTQTVEKLERQVQELVRNADKRPKDKDPKSFKTSPRKPETRSCYNCGKKGHLANDCRKPKKQGNEEGRPETH